MYAIRSYYDKYYKNTFFAKFTIVEPYLYMIFQTSKNATDIKAFKWLVEDNKLTYIDCRSEHEVRFKNFSEFNWVKVTREDHRTGSHPHISVFVITSYNIHYTKLYDDAKNLVLVKNQILNYKLK